jgi:glucuronosyltransferase
VENLHYVFIKGVYKTMYEKYNYDLNEVARRNNLDKLRSSMIGAEWGVMCCRVLLENFDELEGILNYPSDFKFDLIVYDFTFSFCLLPLAHKFKNAPMVGVSPFNPPFTTFFIGGHKHPAYVPHFIIDLPQVMNFYQRFYNHLLYWLDKL